MYRFSVAESANPNDYVGTGAAAGKGALLSQQTVLRNSPNYANLSLRGGREKAKNEINAAGLELAKRREERDLARSELIGTANEAQLKSIQTAIGQREFAGKLALVSELYEKGFGKQRERQAPYQPNFQRREELINDLYTNPSLDDQINNTLERIRSNPSYKGSDQMTNPSSPQTGSEIPNANNPGFGIKIGDPVGGDVSLYPVQSGIGGGNLDQSNSNFQKVNFVPQGYNTLEMSPEEKALKDTIAFAEGTYKPDGGYDIMFGGKRFNSYDKHPMVSKAFSKGTSDAAGRYQFLSTTFKEQAEQLGLQDFSPYSQEVAARALIKRRNVDPNLDYSAPNMFVGMTDKLAPEWASFPYQGISPDGYGRGSSYYGQGGKSVDELRPFYIERLKFYRHPTTPQYGGLVI